MSDPIDFRAYHLLYHLVNAVVSHPKQLEIKTVWVDGGATFSVHVHPEDLGYVVGEGGAMADSLRTVLAGIGRKKQRQFQVQIEAVEPVEEAPRAPNVRSA